MQMEQTLDLISRGRTDLIFEFLRSNGWRTLLGQGPVKPLQWLVYYGDATALQAVLEAGGDLSSLDLNEELGHAAFFGHWRVCDFLLAHGAKADSCVAATGETPLHGALAKAGRPYYLYVVKLLVEHGANVNARTIAGQETGAFMRDVRTKGETPLHRAAAYSDEATIQYLLDHGADPSARDVHGDSPLSWASEHLRPGSILARLAFGPHTISAASAQSITSDHGAGWGTGMERKFLGEYLPQSLPRK